MRLDTGDTGATPQEAIQAPEKALKFTSYTVTGSEHINKGKPNADAIKVDPEKQQVIIADGMGGLKDGFFASRQAVNGMSKRLYHQSEHMQSLPQDQRLATTEKNVAVALQRGSDRVRNEVEGGGATGLIAQFVDVGHEKWVVVGTVGDSPALVFRDNRLHQVTMDDSALNADTSLTPAEKKRIKEKIGAVRTPADEANLSYDEKRHYDGRSIITQHLGQERINPHVVSFRVLPGDQWIFTTDGLTKAASFEQIEAVLRSNNPDKAKALAEMAHSYDDTTLAVVEVPKAVETAVISKKGQVFEEVIRKREKKESHYELGKDLSRWKPDPSWEKPPIGMRPEGKDSLYYLSQGFKPVDVVDLYDIPVGSVAAFWGTHRDASQWILKKESPNEIKLWRFRSPNDRALTATIDTLGAYIASSSGEDSTFRGVVSTYDHGSQKLVMKLPYFDQKVNGDVGNPNQGWIDSLHTIYLREAE